MSSAVMGQAKMLLWPAVMRHAESKAQDAIHKQVKQHLHTCNLLARNGINIHPAYGISRDPSLQSPAMCDMKALATTLAWAEPMANVLMMTRPALPQYAYQ